MGGITAPSFYAAFGSKEDLFREAVETYSKTLGVPMMKAPAEEPTARASLEALLQAAVEAFCRPGKPPRLLLVLGVINSMPAKTKQPDHLHGLRRRRQKVIQERLQRGVAEGELPSGLDLGALASFYTTVVDDWPFGPRRCLAQSPQVRGPLRDGGLLGHGGRGSRSLNFLRGNSEPLRSGFALRMTLE